MRSKLLKRADRLNHRFMMIGSKTRRKPMSPYPFFRKYLLFIAVVFLATLNGCVTSFRPIDVDHVQPNVIKGKTTISSS